MIADKIKNLGVIGAGGAGFPTYIKASSKANILIANGAECEPLIHKDFEIMVNYAERVVDGMKLMMKSINAEKGIIGIKEKNQTAIEAIQKALKNTKNISIHLLGDFYPSGDEFVLVYESTGKLIPAAGIPLDIGIVVNNVETFYNISMANEDVPVTKKFLSVSGAVKNRITFQAPIGLSYKEAIKAAGGASVSDFALYVSGVMMGNLEFDLTKPITKTTAGLIVLPLDHKLIKRKNQPVSNYFRIGKSACDQCSYCTELCPRYILGYNIQPHKVMRSLEFTKSGEDLWNEFAELCCACGLCTLYSCPEDLFPKEICDKAKDSLRNKNIFPKKDPDIKIHPMYKSRRTPLDRLMRKLDLLRFESHNPLRSIDFRPEYVEISLKQGIGMPSIPIVKEGELVTPGQKIADIPEGKSGAPHHSSIGGRVKKVDEKSILIKSLEN
jgi:Na+-translocating ferredoxin:NAD+ oxidoreductase RnfC subunit